MALVNTHKHKRRSSRAGRRLVEAAFAGADRPLGSAQSLNAEKIMLVTSGSLFGLWMTSPSPGADAE